MSSLSLCLYIWLHRPQYLSLPLCNQDCYLVSILNELAGNSFMIFCSTCNNAQRVALMLRNLGITAIPLHGQMSQVNWDRQCRVLTVSSMCKTPYSITAYWTATSEVLMTLRLWSSFRTSVSGPWTSSRPSLAPSCWPQTWHPGASTFHTSTVSSTTTSPPTPRCLAAPPSLLSLCPQSELSVLLCTSCLHTCRAVLQFILLTTYFFFNPI